MKEKIILAPGANAGELLRSLAGSGVNTLGTRVVGPVELARTALIRSGISTGKRFLPAREEPQQTERRQRIRGRRGSAEGRPVDRVGKRCPL